MRSHASGASATRIGARVRCSSTWDGERDGAAARRVLAASLARSTTDILSETGTMRRSGLGFPSEGAAIAQNGAGDYLLLVLDGV